MIQTIFEEPISMRPKVPFLIADSTANTASSNLSLSSFISISVLPPT